MLSSPNISCVIDPPRKIVERSEQRTNDRRTATENGTASSALAPSKRPVFAAHRSKYSGVVSPPGPNVTT
jgi:hypothetical protein